MNKVINFLKKFQSQISAKEPLSRDCCYWFAAILFGRFIRDGAEIVYDDSAEHFGTRINGRVYDITGDVTDTYTWVSWRSIPDSDHKKEIVSKYITF